MTNALESSSFDATRAARAAYLEDAFKAERWTFRKIAAACGLTQTYVGRRLNGYVDLSFPDIELFAGILKMTPEALFLELLHAGDKKGPKSGVSGPSLPDLDSNQEPAGFAPAPIRLVPRTTTKPLRTMPGVVIPMHRDVSDRDVS